MIPVITLQQEKNILNSLLGKRSAEYFSAAELGRKAHWRWDRGQYLEAAVLFEAAALRSAQEVRLVRPERDNTFNYRIRSGVTFRLAGQYDRAWPILVEAITFDWQAAGIPEDRGFTEWAFVDMLCILAEKQDTQGFSSLFWQAVARGEELGFHFPHIHPKQELLLDLCEQLGLSAELVHVIECIEAQRKMSRRLKLRVSQLKSNIESHF